MAKKTTKPATKEPQVNIGEAISRSETFFQNNKNTIFTVFAAIIVLIVGVMLYKSKVVIPRENRVAEYLFQGENYFIDGEFELALEGDAYDFLGFIEIADNYSNTKAGNLAKAYAGISFAKLDSFDIAIKYLAKFKGKDQMVTPSVLGALADCYASTNQPIKAAETFKKAAKVANNNLLSPYFLFQAGLVYESMEKTKQAIDVFNRIKNEYPSSLQAADVEKYLIRLSNR